MANIKDYVDEGGNPKPVKEVEGEQAEVKKEAVPSTDLPEPEEIPEKYQNKSVNDLVKMHKEAEQYLGKQGQEFGELRKQNEELKQELQRVIDTLILQQGKPEEEEVDYLSDPASAIDKHPTVKKLQEKLTVLEGMGAVQQLYAKHPDASQVARSPEFTEWVMEETGRQALFKQVQNNDPIAADALLSDFKKSKRKTPDNQRSEVKKASTGATTASTAPTSRKVYKRNDIIELMKTDPRKYQSWLKDDGKRAYAEGRVR